jgi:Flp pilus assembly protein TadD
MLILLAVCALATLAAVWLGIKSSNEPAHGGGPVERVNPAVAPLAHQDQAKAREVDLRFKEAVVMLHAKQYEHALTALHRVLELSPKMPEAHVNMGYTLLGLERFSAARDFFSSAVELRPMQANAYYGLALALEALNDRQAALGAMRSFVHLAKPDDPFVRKGRAALWEWQSAGAASGPAPSPASNEKTPGHAKAGNAK